MAIVVFEHEPLETSGRLGQALRDEGHRLRVIRLHEGDSVPVDLDDIDGIISMGGSPNVDEQDQYDWMPKELDIIRKAHEAKLPIVGICLGAQLIAVALGGEVSKMERAEIGWAPLRSSFFGTVDPIMAGIPWQHPALHLHSYEVSKTPPGGTPMPLASSDMCKAQIFKVGFNVYGFQHHFELTHDQINPIFDHFTDWIAREGYDLQQLKAETEKQFELWEHLGDRLCRNLATLIFPLTKRNTA